MNPFSNRLLQNNKIMLIGSGGREHAIAWKLSQSPLVEQIFVVPGNGGTSQLPKVRNITDSKDYLKLVREHNIDFVCVGPEQPLVDGIVDELLRCGIPCFGPSESAARLEGSKAFSKEFMKRNGIATAKFETFTDIDKACAFLKSVDYPVVIKASGLAAGKGVVLPETLEEGLEELKSMMTESKFGDAGNEIVIEERLFGEEISVLAFCDGHRAVLMPAAQDHKRIFDDDKGPNTGGMGTIAPAPVFNNYRLKAQVYDAIDRTISAAKREGFPFKGVLFTGFIISHDGPKVLEYNCRFGDPETQSVLQLLESDLFLIMNSCATGTLAGTQVKWRENVSACTIMTASAGYPGGYKKGEKIVGLESVEQGDQVVFHSGTKVINGETLTNGGRVLAVSSVRNSLEQALSSSYDILKNKVSFNGMQYRQDIGKKSLMKPLKIGVLGSTRGTDLQYIIDAIKNGCLNATIQVVCSNKSSAFILERAQQYGIKSVHVSSKGLQRDEYDRKLTQVLNDNQVDLVLLIGFMRILSDSFVTDWAGKVLNVHPSLLPEFGGGMDLDVHQAVIDAGKKVTGCTIHFVTSEVDGGPIAVVRRCMVDANETKETLKSKVQALEGPAFIQAIFQFMNGQFNHITNT